jgi:hypothetical protein
MEAVLKQWCTDGLEVLSADVARLSPLVHKRVNFQGRSSCARAESIAQGNLCPLHDSDAMDVEHGRSQYSLLVGVNSRDRSPGLGTRQQILTNYGLTVRG